VNSAVPETGGTAADSARLKRRNRFRGAPRNGAAFCGNMPQQVGPAVATQPEATVASASRKAAASESHERQPDVISMPRKASTANLAMRGLGVGKLDGAERGRRPSAFGRRRSTARDRGQPEFSVLVEAVR
jgi:hypothetical protein